METDQESSLIQAIRKYIDITNDHSILQDTISGATVIKRIEMAMNYILKERWSSKHGLVTGAITVDWGDVQPDRKNIGVVVNEETKWAIDVYDNAMFYMAIHDFMKMAPKNSKPQQNWVSIAANLKKYPQTFVGIAYFLG